MSIPELQLLPSLAQEKGHDLPVERGIDGYTLTAIAPDKESFVRGAPSIEYIRHKIALGYVDTTHWLYSVRERSDIRLDTDELTFKFRKSSEQRPRPTCVYIIDPQDTEDALSRCQPEVDDRSPSHTIIAYDTTPLSGIFSELKECLINDLIFAANCPNLPGGRSLPYRVDTELPRMLLHVRHLGTFPALVVYLHTKNQAALFREVMPEWVRDTMHPLPVAPAPATQLSRGRKISIIVKSSGYDPNEDRLRVSPRTVESIARDLVDTEARISLAAGSTSDLVGANVKLNGLKDNLNLVGYYDAELWRELEMMLTILRKAMNIKAKIDG